MGRRGGPRLLRVRLKGRWVSGGVVEFSVSLLYQSRPEGAPEEEGMEVMLRDGRMGGKDGGGMGGTKERKEEGKALGCWKIEGRTVEGEEEGRSVLKDERRGQGKRQGSEGPTSFVFITGRSWMTLAK